MAVAIDQVKRLAQEHGNELAFTVNHSGGKDSTRMLGFIRKKFPDSPTYAVMVDTGFEHVSPISAADFARARCAEFGLELTTVRNPKRTYLEMVGAARYVSVAPVSPVHLRSKARTDRKVHS